MNSTISETEEQISKLKDKIGKLGELPEKDSE